jgi:adenylate cyclase
MHEGFLWEVDVFSGRNEGLVVAELELESENQVFPRPDWLLEEVSGDKRYYNSYLSEHPFQEWTD